MSLLEPGSLTFYVLLLTLSNLIGIAKIPFFTKFSLFALIFALLVLLIIFSILAEKLGLQSFEKEVFNK